MFIMEENETIVKEEPTDIKYTILATTLMLIGIVATGNKIMSGGKKLAIGVHKKLMKKKPE